MLRPVCLVALSVGALGLAGCGVGAEASKVSPVAPERSTAAPPGDAAVVPGGDSVRLRADLDGDALVPGPGDEDGSGEAVVVLEPSRSEVCYEITVEGIADATAAHVHDGPAGVPGDVVLGLDAPEGGTASGCATADGVLLGRVAADPGRFYLAVHAEDHPDGAVRGQLAPVAR